MIFKGYERIDAPDVYDGLDSTSTEVALSARQGNVLNEKINQGGLVTKLTLTSKPSRYGDVVFGMTEKDVLSLKLKKVNK